MSSYFQLDVWQYLEDLGMKHMEEDAVSVRFSCPFPGHSTGDSTPSISMSKDFPYPFNCFTCGEHGSAVTFLSILEGIAPYRAARLIRERFDRYIPPSTTVQDELRQLWEKVPEGSRFLEDHEASDRAVNWMEAHFSSRPLPAPIEYMFQRGFSPETLTTYDVGYDPISSRITLPYRTVDLELVGFKARAWDSDVKPRYKVLGGKSYGFSPFDIGKHLFGLHLFAVPMANPLVIVEGELNSMMMWQHGIPRPVGISGQTITRDQIKLIINHCDEAILVFDEAEKALEAGEKLIPYLKRVLIAPEHDDDPADNTKEENQRLVSQAKSFRDMIIFINREKERI